jgi:hypothetical protein
MIRFPRPRKAVDLPDSVHRQLNMYAMGASAAGVSVLALGLSANARIVYTPSHRVLHRGHPGLTNLDLNHDGVIDFTFDNLWASSRGSQFGHLSVITARAENGVEGYGPLFASALRAGVSVGRKGHFLTARNDLMDIGNESSAISCQGPWKDVKDRYLGMKFVIKGELHFGWARLNVSCNSHNHQTTAVLTGYAYETIPGKSIIAGKTKGTDLVTAPEGSLGQLAVGRK